MRPRIDQKPPRKSGLTGAPLATNVTSMIVIQTVLGGKYWKTVNSLTGDFKKGGIDRECILKL